MGEKMFWVPQSVLENLIKPVTEEVRLSAMYEAGDILSGKVERRPSLTPTAEEYTRYFNHHVTDEGLAQMAGERGYSLLKRQEVSEADVAARIDDAVAQPKDGSVNIPPGMAAHIANTGTPHTQDAGVSQTVAQKSEDAGFVINTRGIKSQPSGLLRLALGVNKNLNVRRETDEIELELGTFNTDKLPVAHTVYKISPEKLAAQMDKLIGCPIGEIGQSQFTNFTDHAAMMERLMKTIPEDAWGTLKSYRIQEQEDSSLRVYGTVQLTNRGRVTMADSKMALCSIRTECMQTRTGNGYPPTVINDVLGIAGFDLVAE